MDGDDELIGRVLTRREMLALLGGTGVMLIGGCSPARRPAASRGTTPDSLCVVRPEMTEGPYFVDEMLNRSDVRSDPSDGTTKPGAPLQLTFNVSRLAGSSCEPLSGALVDVWQCDALGLYSDVRDPEFDTVGKKFLRGYQVTDARGIARFTTIYPGWYPGRTVHVHFKIRSAPSSRPGFEFTSQLFFDDGLTDQVHARPPYAARGRRTVRNPEDGIFADGGGQLLLAVTPHAEGYAAPFNVALQTA